MNSNVIFFLVLLMVPTFLASCPEPNCEIPTDANCPSICPQDCGEMRKDNGCLECVCGETFFYAETPLPPQHIEHE
uniref:Antistasin-like domain-containing protein n=1 Tax=Strigamia maritima TaxID=126957 RepID=T1JJ90_STRMM